MLITTHPNMAEAAETLEGFKVPIDFLVRADYRVGPAPHYDFIVELVGRYDATLGEYVAQTLRIRPEITGERLRKVQIAALLYRGAVEATRGSVRPTNELRALRPQGPTDEVLEQVARVYRIAVICRFRPVRDVAEAFGVPRPTAARWVQLARDRGFLREAEPGRAGERKPRGRRG